MATLDTKWVDRGSVYVITGYSSTSNFGSISDTQNGTLNADLDGVYSGADVTSLTHANISTGTVSLTLSGNRANSGWDTMTIGSTTYNRTDASYSYNSSANTTNWSWNGVGSTSPFGSTNGTDTQVVWATTSVDTTPNQFTFTDVSNVAISTTQTSNTITISGMDTGASATVTITGGTYSKNSGAYTSSSGTASNGDTFSVRHTSSSSYNTAVNTVLTIGGVSDTYTSTTGSFSGATYYVDVTVTADGLISESFK